MDRAYSLLEIKSVDTDRRVFSGMATTPDVDRQGHSVNPKGVRFKNPLPLLFHHDQKRPVGTVTFKKATDEGIPFEGAIPLVEEPGAVKDRTDEAWHSVKSGLIPGVSIGWRPTEDADSIELLPNGVVRLNKIEVLELSLVTVPANAKATIRLVKSLDLEHLAASGHHPPGVSGTLPVVRANKGATTMKIAEQIAAFETTLAAKLERVNEIQTKASGENRTKDEAERQESDDLRAEIKSLQMEIADLKEVEALNVATATPVSGVKSVVAAGAVRGANPIITVKANVPKGTAFTRYVMAMAAGKGDYMRTIETAKQWKDSTPEVLTMVELQLKAAVAPGTTTDATWAGPLAPTQTLVDEFLELLRPKTLIGRIPGFTQVPFNVTVPSQTGGGTYGWVGQNKPKPVTSAAFATSSLSFAKASGIIVLTEELVRLSSPSAEQVVRREMINGMQQFLDGQLIDPAVAAVANVNPASITNGAPTAAAAGPTAANAKADLAAAIATFTAAELSLSESVFLMNESNAFALSISVNSLGQPLFPGFTVNGGTLLGVNTVVSNAVGNRIVLIHAPSILFADEGGVSIDVSREASLQMDSAPDDPVTASTVLVSLWQRNLVGLRAERFITWLRARTAAVRVITAAAYTGA